MNHTKEIKQTKRKQKIENIIDDYFDLVRFFELATSNKKYDNGLNFHEIGNEILLGYKGVFELNGLMVIGPVEHKTNIRFKNMYDFASHRNAIDINFDSEDLIFTGYVYKLNTPQIKIGNRSAYSKSTNYMQKTVEYRGQNCYLPTSGMCFIKCNKYFTKMDFTQEFRDCIRKEKYRSGEMTSARIQPPVENIISTLVFLMERDLILETLLNELKH